MEIHLELMGKINELPYLERPREKAKRFGIGTLNNIELLALIIGSGTKDNSAMDIAYRLTSLRGFSHLNEIQYSELVSIKGIEQAKALKLMAIFEIYNRLSLLESDDNINSISSFSLFQKYRYRMSKLDQEILVVVILDQNRNIIKEETLYTGSHTQIPFSFHDIFKVIMTSGGSYFYLLHNHPEGHLFPSEADILLTQELIREAKKLSVTLLDHIIIAKNQYFSFVEEERQNEKQSSTFLAENKI